MHRLLFAVTMAFLLVYSAGEAMAYTRISCGSTYLKWASNWYATSASSGGFPAGPWRDALTMVVSRWNNNPSLLAYSLSYDDASVGFNNGQSEVWWSSGFGAPAAAFWWFNSSSCQFTEVDILFDNTVSYHTTTGKSSLLPYGGSFRPFQTTAMHEFGHAGGLGHTANTFSIMGQDWTHIQTNGNTARAFPGEDASAGMVALYGLWAGGPEDVGVVHWRRTGASGEYSTHCRTRLFNSSSAVLPLFSGVSCWGAEPVYRVSKGQVVQLELSYESLGKSSLSVPVGYYLSTDSTITTADRFLGSTTMTFGRNTVLTWKKTLTIPTNLTSNTTYYLGAVVDYTGALGELYEYNNATYTAIRVQ